MRQKYLLDSVARQVPTTNHVTVIVIASCLVRVVDKYTAMVEW